MEILLSTLPLYLFIFLFGLCIGSFLNAWLWRLHRDESIIGRRSYCPKCLKQIGNWDLIPVLSFFFLGGKCRWCRQKISWQYPLVELAVGFLYVISFKIADLKFDLTTVIGQAYLFLYWYCLIILIVVFVFDLKYYLILDRVVWPATALIFVINLILGRSSADLFSGAIIASGFFGLQYLLPSLGRKLTGKKYRLFQTEWIGLGDVTLGVLLGIMLGWQLTILTLFLAYLLGAGISIILLAFGKKKLDSQLPFGSFLAPAAIIALLWGDQILDWYWKLV